MNSEAGDTPPRVPASTDAGESSDRKLARTEKQASKVRATEKKLEQLTAVEKPWEGWQLQMALAPTARSGDVVARLEGAVVEREAFSLGPVDLEVRWKDRVAILGPNGSGKSTLLSALLGRTELTAGRRWTGPGVVVGEMDQTRGAYATGTTVLDTFLAETALPLDEARSLLAKFGLGAEFVVRADPQVIMVSDREAVSLGSRPGWNRIRAVRDGRVCLFTPEQGDVLVRAGPRMAEAVRLMVQCLQGRPPATAQVQGKRP